MADTGWVKPGTGQSITTGWWSGAKVWSTPGNVTADDTSYAQSIYTTTTDDSDTLISSNFGLSVPTDATIDGVEFRIMRKKGVGLGNVYDVHLKLGTSTSAPSGNEKGATSTSWPSSDGLATYGGAADLWGATLAPSDVNGSGFCFGHQARVSGSFGGSPDAYVDYDEVKVHYTPSYAGQPTWARRGSLWSPPGIAHAGRGW